MAWEYVRQEGRSARGEGGREGRVRRLKDVSA